MKINSRKKGARGEKKACEVLTTWTSYPFHRVPQSGGLRWKTEFTVGDLVCGDAIHRFDFSVESKNYKDINFEHLLMDNQNISKIEEFWQQCKSDAKRGKKLPLLMMRYDGIRPADHFFTVLSVKDFKALKPLLNMDHPYLYCRHHGFVIMHPGCLFKTNYKSIKKLTNKIIEKLYGAN